MSLYRVTGPDDECDARGLTLEEAFVRLMAWAEADYVFTRIEGIMLLQLMPTRSFSDFALLDPGRSADRRALRAKCPLYQSQKASDRDARRDLMLQAIAGTRPGYTVCAESAATLPGERAPAFRF
jgi:hypothetical protein